MSQPLLGAVFDLDGTLAPDTTTQLLIDLGMDPDPFWARVAERMQHGWDHVLAYMTQLMEGGGPGTVSLTRERMVRVGSHAHLMPGVLELVGALNNSLAQVGWGLECYLVSSGLLPLVESLPIASGLAGIWASDFDYDIGGRPIAIKNVISFTDKTRPLIAISKGISCETLASHPFAVNDRASAFRIPFSQMIFVGDGFTDIPCFSLVKRGGGLAIAVHDGSPGSQARADSLLSDRRVRAIAEADFRPDGAGMRAVLDGLLQLTEAATGGLVQGSGTSAPRPSPAAPREVSGGRSS